MIPRLQSLSVSAACGLAALMTALPAQQGTSVPRTDPKPTTSPRPAHFVVLSDILGADVRMRANAEERQEAREDGEVAKGPKGEIDELVLRPDGGIGWAVVDVGGFLGMGEKSVAVPIAALDCRPKGDNEATVTIAATEKQLKALSEIDLDKAEKAGGLSAALRTAEASWNAHGLPTEGAMKRDHKDSTGRDSTGADSTGKDSTGAAERAHGTVGSATPASTNAQANLICASKIDDWKVRATDGEFGEISKVFVAIDERPCVDYVVVECDTPGIGSTDFLVPFQALTCTKNGDDWVWTVAKTKDELMRAVKYTKPSHGVLDADLGGRTDTFFGVDRHAHDGRVRDHDKKMSETERKRDGK